MDKAMLIKVVDKANFDTIVIPSMASRSDRERLVKAFLRKANRAHYGEIGLVVIRT